MDPPEEGPDFSEQSCPLLYNGLCRFYEGRPFGCRCFFSQMSCEANQEAIAPPELVSVNIAFLQLIEHIDRHGLFGNMLDVLDFLENGNGRDVDHEDRSGRSPDHLIPNQILPGYLIPPEHQTMLRDLLERLFQTRTDRGTFGQYMDLLERSFQNDRIGRKE